MTITQHISIDLQQPGNAPMIHAVQGDEYTRKVEIDLYSGGVAWNPPSGCEVVIRYGKPDGKGGVYGNLPDDTTAWSIDGNTISVILAPQMLTVPGIVNAQAQLIVDGKQIVSTFHFAVNVEEDPSKGAVKSENYVNWKTYYIPQTAGAIAGQYLQISKVDADGKVVGVKPVDDPAKGAKDYANAAYDKANEALSTAETAGQLADIAIGKSDQALNGLSYMSQDIQRIEDEQQDVKDSISGKLPAPITAKVGQTIVVKSIDENGAVTAVKAVDAPSGGGGDDEVFVKLEDGTVVPAEVEFDFSDESTPALVVVPGTAKVGQTVVVKAVDESGKPTEWEAVDLPSGGGTKWELITEYTVADVVNSVTFSEDMNGAPFSLSKMKIFMVLPKYDYEGQEGTGYAQYSINDVYNYEYPASAWDNGSFIGDIECFGNFCIAEWRKITEEKHGGASNNWTIFGGIKQIGESGVFDTIHSFKWGLFNRKVLPGSTFKIYGVRV